jgi:hypothetical protein
MHPSPSLQLDMHKGRSLSPAFRRDGDVWTLTYEGLECSLPNTSGLPLLAALLRQPGMRVAVADLTQGAAVGEECCDRMKEAIESAVQDIAVHHYALGLHLRATIKVGTTCAYVPDPRVPIVWEVDFVGLPASADGRER